MIFPRDYAGLLMRHAKRFTFGNITSLPHSRSGVYLFVHKETFVYVGKSSEALGVRERLLVHYRDTHNDRLHAWLSALDGDVGFTYLTCREWELDDLEKSLITFLQPRANEIRYRQYTPKTQKWSKHYG